MDVEKSKSSKYQKGKGRAANERGGGYKQNSIGKKIRGFRGRSDY